MKRKTLDRMIKLIHEINEGPFSYPIVIKRLKPLNLQTNYNVKLREWYGVKLYDVVATTTGIFSAFKESEDWKEIGTFSIHDWKCNINDDVDIDTNCIVERTDTGEVFEVVFKREYIGEFTVGLRPVNSL
jgi:rRNA maturation protein Rpf1